MDLNVEREVDGTGSWSYPGVGYGVMGVAPYTLWFISKDLYMPMCLRKYPSRLRVSVEADLGTPVAYLTRHKATVTKILTFQTRFPGSRSVYDWYHAMQASDNSPAVVLQQNNHLGIYCNNNGSQRDMKSTKIIMWDWTCICLYEGCSLGNIQGVLHFYFGLYFKVDITRNKEKQTTSCGMWFRVIWWRGTTVSEDRAFNAGRLYPQEDVWYSFLLEANSVLNKSETSTRVGQNNGNTKI
jgi:hypothetical protein